MQLVTIKNLPNESFTVIKVNNLDNLPNLKQHLIDKNFDGNIYTLKRITDGTRKKEYSVDCYKASKHDTYIRMV